MAAAASSPILNGNDSAKNLRGLNKPKCTTCGNVARSRCPFKSCKNCCFKAQNPCHIHVLKANATLADRGASANSGALEQQPNEVTPPGPSAKVTSIRHLSNAFSQFNNVHIPLRSRKPLSRAEALVINEWRFAKLKEYKESNIEAENEAFDRYMRNISLLEEVFDVNSEKLEDEGTQLTNLPVTSGENAKMLSEMKVKIRSNPVRIDTFRKRIRHTVDQGLEKLLMYTSKKSSGNLEIGVGHLTPNSEKNWWNGKTSALTQLNERLNRAQNEEDLKLCVQKRAKIKGQLKLGTSDKNPESTEITLEGTIPDDSGAIRGSEDPLLEPVRVTEIDQDALNKMEFYFSSLEEIEEL